jgi:predicted regulator of Ras-like GTPase activity (Roadblock/LC7/MglB family)
MNQLVTSFVKATPGVAHAVVAAPDGRLLGFSDPLPRHTAREAAAVVSLVQSVARGAARFLHAGPVTRTVVQMDDGLLLILSVHNGIALAVFAEPDVDAGGPAEAATRFVARLASQAREG